jgi:hypothetical protein
LVEAPLRALEDGVGKGSAELEEVALAKRHDGLILGAGV